MLICKERGCKIYLGGFYGKYSAIIACFAVAVYIVQHSAKIARAVDTGYTIWPNYPSFSGAITT